MIKLIHSYWAYLTLIILAIATINAIIGFFSKRDYVSKDLRIGLFALIVSHIQFLLGILLYFTSPLFALWSASGVQAIMQDRYSRKMLVEHPLMILIAVTLITIGWSLHKKQKTSQRAFGKIALFYALALLSILFVIPWNVWI